MQRCEIPDSMQLHKPGWQRHHKPTMKDQLVISGAESPCLQIRDEHNKREKPEIVSLYLVLHNVMR